MARLWQEGFEDGFPHAEYLAYYNSTLTIGNLYIPFYPLGEYADYVRTFMELAEPRNAITNNSFKITLSNTALSSDKNILNNRRITYTLDDAKDGIYFRVWFKWYQYEPHTNLKEFLSFCDTTGTKVFGITQQSDDEDAHIYVNLGGSYTSVYDVTIQKDIWTKIDVYLKKSATVGEYSVKINNLEVCSATAVNTGSNGIKTIYMGYDEGQRVPNHTYGHYLMFDDIALNDDTGSINNSWCGDGTIVSLKPNGAGNSSEWDTCEGFAYAESGTDTTTIKVTSHGLSTNDVIYNKTRDSYRIVTVSDANTLTVSSVSSQAEGDEILLYINVDSATAESDTGTSVVVLTGNALQSGDVIVNTTRSNAIRKVIAVDGAYVYNYLAWSTNGYDPINIGSAVTSQTSGDSIKTFQFYPYAITNHWEAVANQSDPSPKLSYVKTTTVNDIDTYDMEELVADKGFPANSTVVAISHNVYAKEAGAGSQMKPVFRISGTDYAGDTQTLIGGTKQYQKIYETSPDTSSAWSLSEVDGLESGVKMV